MPPTMHTVLRPMPTPRASMTFFGATITATGWDGYGQRIAIYCTRPRLMQEKNRQRRHPRGKGQRDTIMYCVLRNVYCRAQCSGSHTIHCPLHTHPPKGIQHEDHGSVPLSEDQLYPSESPRLVLYRPRDNLPNLRSSVPTSGRCVLIGVSGR